MLKKWILVTGGAKGLGKEIAITLAEGGASVVIQYNKSCSEAEQLQVELNAKGFAIEIIQGSFDTEAETNDFIHRYSKNFPDTKHLVNNVGNYLIKPLIATTYWEMAALFQTNLYAPFLLIQGLLGAIEKNRGSIVNIGMSGLGMLKGDLNAAVYTMTKIALLSMTKSLARELAPRHVRVNMVSPGQLENAVDLPTTYEKFPMKRPGKLGEVANVVAFLLSDENEYITGQNIDVAGGLGL